MRKIKDYEIQKEDGEKKVIEGRKFDIIAPGQKLLSMTDKSFRSLLGEMSTTLVAEILGFIQYLMTAEVLIPISGYGTIYYYPRGVKREKKNLKEFRTTHEFAAIIEYIRAGRFDPSEVLHALVATFPKDKANRAMQAKIFAQARKLILEGYSVTVKV